MVYTDSDRGFAFNFFEGTPRTFAWLAIGAGRTAVLLEDDFGVLDAPNSVHVISGAFEQNPGDAVPIWDVLPENNRHFAKRAYDGYGPPLFGTLGRAVQCVVKRRSKKESYSLDTLSRLLDADQINILIRSILEFDVSTWTPPSRSTILKDHLFVVTQIDGRLSPSRASIQSVYGEHSLREARGHDMRKTFEIHVTQQRASELDTGARRLLGQLGDWLNDGKLNKLRSRLKPTRRTPQRQSSRVL